MIYKIEVKIDYQEIIWQWYWRKNFKRFSRWHHSTDSFDFNNARMYKDDFNWDDFRFCSRLSVPLDAKKEAFEKMLAHLKHDFDVFELKFHVVNAQDYFTL